MRYTIEYAYVSECGHVRKVNQDNYFCFDTFSPRACERTDGVRYGRATTAAGAMFAVFDGMGGEQAGEDASYIAASTAADYVKSGNQIPLRGMCEEANKRIVAFTVSHGLEVCGATAAIMYFLGGNAQVCNLGDSRIYRVLQDRVIQLSEDQVVALPDRKKPALLRFLGMDEPEEALRPFLTGFPIKQNDCFLLCSDGLTDMVPEREMAAMMHGQHALKDAVQALLSAALAAGGRDNTTIILVRVVSVKKQWKDYFSFLRSGKR